MSAVVALAVFEAGVSCIDADPGEVPAGLDGTFVATARLDDRADTVDVVLAAEASLGQVSITAGTPPGPSKKQLW